MHEVIRALIILVFVAWVKFAEDTKNRHSSDEAKQADQGR